MDVATYYAKQAVAYDSSGHFQAAEYFYLASFTAIWWIFLISHHIYDFFSDSFSLGGCKITHRTDKQGRSKSRIEQDSPEIYRKSRKTQGTR